MKRRNVVASIDVGTTKICTILADVDDVGGPQVVQNIAKGNGCHFSHLCGVDRTVSCMNYTPECAFRQAPLLRHRRHCYATGRWPGG